MSDEIKKSDSEKNAVDGYFDSLIEDFDLKKSGDAPVIPESGDDSRPKGMRDFSKFFNDAAAFGSGFESTIDKSPDEIAAQADPEAVDFTAANTEREIITTPITDEDGMIVIYDEEAGIDATASAADIAAETTKDAAEKHASEDNSAVGGSVTEPSDEADNNISDAAEAPESNAEADSINDDDKYSADENITSETSEETAADSDNSAPEPEKKRSFIQGIIPWKGDSVAEIIRKIVFIASTGVFVAAGIMLLSTLMQSEEAQEELQSIKESVTTTVATTINSDGEIETIPPTTEERREHNESLMDSFVQISGNVKGFIELPACDIYYPVVQGTDNDYYLTRTYDDRKNKAGSIFMDYRCTVSEEYTSPNVVLYGHNQEDGTMFGNLKYYKNNVEFYRENPKVSFNTEYDIGDYVIFGYFITNVYEHQDSGGEVFHYQDYIETLNTESTFNWYMKEINERNQIISPVDVVYGDKLLLLSTCSNEFSDSRFVVIARKLREGESYADFDFSSARLNPNAKQIDWSAILSEATEETTEETTTTETTTVTTTETTTETTTVTTEASETEVQTHKSDKVVSELGLAPIIINGTTAPPYSESEVTESETSEITESVTTTQAWYPTMATMP